MVHGSHGNLTLGLEVALDQPYRQKNRAERSNRKLLLTKSEITLSTPCIAQKLSVICRACANVV